MDEWQRRRETKPSASDPARELAQHGYDPLGPIAAGAFSTILRARPMAGGADVAVKTFDNARCEKAAVHGEARDRELAVLRLDWPSLCTALNTFRAARLVLHAGKELVAELGHHGALHETETERLLDLIAQARTSERASRPTDTHKGGSSRESGD